MKQRFGIAQALLGEPRLIIVDEPTAGLDPRERNRFYNLLSEIGENTVVILSTHIVEDVSTLCSDMAIMGNGRVLLEGSPARVEQSLKNRLWMKEIAKPELEKYDGKVLARGGRFQILEGPETFGRFVVIEFPSLERAGSGAMAWKAVTVEMTSSRPAGAHTSPRSRRKRSRPDATSTRSSSTGRTRRRPKSSASVGVR